jgi:hypothetical protein
MFARSAAEAADAAALLEILFGAGAPRSLVSFLAGAGQPG